MRTEDQMTPEEQRLGEMLEERLAREEPERGPEATDVGDGQLVAEGSPDVEKDMAGEMATGPRDVDDEDELLEALGSAGNGEPAMEEAAIRVVRGEVAGGSDAPDDGYVAEEEGPR
jgi:hypothetical protein